jgi:hypothetical protein
MRMIFFIVLLFTNFLWVQVSFTQELFTENEPKYFLTIYVMKSLKPLHWESPSSLYKSVKNGYWAKLFRHNQYVLGHMAVKLEFPSMQVPTYSGMVSNSQKEKIKLLWKEKAGLGILGAPMGGHIASTEETLEKIELYEKLGKVACIKYLISKEAAERIGIFMEEFNRVPENGVSSSSYYGGAFWPRYYHEGAGCTAYGMAILDVAGLLGEDQKKWKKKINIPMALIGGEFNKPNKVHNREIIKTKSWCFYPHDSLTNCFPFEIYDNNLVFDWIKIHREKADTSVVGKYMCYDEGDIPGIMADMRYVVPSPDEPVFTERPDSSIFIRRHLRMLAKKQPGGN